MPYIKPKLEMLDMRKVTAASALVGALALPATATAVPITDAAEGYRGLGGKAVDTRTANPIPDAADGYRGLGANAVENRAPDPQLARPADTRVTPVVRVIDASGEAFHWDDAGIGAAGGLAVIAIAGGIAMAATGRRRSPRRVTSTS